MSKYKQKKIIVSKEHIKTLRMIIFQNKMINEKYDYDELRWLCNDWENFNRMPPNLTSSCEFQYNGINKE